MARTIRFHLDENCDPRIAAGLTLHGVDVTTTPEAGLLHTSDETQLAYAGAQGRVIVTYDTDFLRIAAAGLETPGVAFYPGQGHSIGQVIRKLLLI
jgi:predicted nuclease of predicted toxin-antitoxin system